MALDTEIHTGAKKNIRDKCAKEHCIPHMCADNGREDVHQRYKGCEIAADMLNSSNLS